MGSRGCLSKLHAGGGPRGTTCGGREAIVVIFVQYIHKYIVGERIMCLFLEEPFVSDVLKTILFFNIETFEIV